MAENFVFVVELTKKAFVHHLQLHIDREEKSEDLYRKREEEHMEKAKDDSGYKTAAYYGEQANAAGERWQFLVFVRNHLPLEGRVFLTIAEMKQLGFPCNIPSCSACDSQVKTDNVGLPPYMDILGQIGDDTQ